MVEEDRIQAEMDRIAMTKIIGSVNNTSTMPPSDIQMLNRIVYNLAQRIIKLEDTMLQVLSLQVVLEESITALERKLEPQGANEVN